MSSIPAAVAVVAQALTQNATPAEIVDRLIADGHIVGAQSQHTQAFADQYRAAGGTISR